MKNIFYLDGEKTTRKAVKELIGEERMSRMLREARETFMEEPGIHNDFFLGRQMLTIDIHTNRRYDHSNKSERSTPP